MKSVEAMNTGLSPEIEAEIASYNMPWQEVFVTFDGEVIPRGELANVTEAMCREYSPQAPNNGKEIK